MPHRGADGLAVCPAPKALSFRTGQTVRPTRHANFVTPFRTRRQALLNRNKSIVYERRNSCIYVHSQK